MFGGQTRGFGDLALRAAPAETRLLPFSAGGREGRPPRGNIKRLAVDQAFHPETNRGIVKMPDRTKTGGYAEIVLFSIAVVWGLNTPVVKIGLLEMSPVAYNALRLALGSLVAAAALLLSRTWRPMPWRDVRAIVVLGLAFGVNQIFFVYGISLTTAGNAALVLSTLPVVVVLLGRLLYGETVARRTAAGIAFTLAGIFLIVAGSDQEISLSGPHIAGAILILASQFCYAYYTIYIKRLVFAYSIYQIVAWVLAQSAVLFALAAFPGLAREDGAAIFSWTWGSILFSGVIALTAANYAWVWAVGVVGSAKASLYPNLSPVFAIAFAWLYLDETFGLLQAAGAAVIFFGLYLTRGSTARPPAGEKARSSC